MDLTQLRQAHALAWEDDHVPGHHARYGHVEGVIFVLQEGEPVELDNLVRDPSTPKLVADRLSNHHHNLHSRTNPVSPGKPLPALD